MTSILKTWTASGLTCKLWQEPGEQYRGCVFVGGQPAYCAEAPLAAGENAAVRAVEVLAELAASDREPKRFDDSAPFSDVAMALSPDTDMPESERLSSSFSILDDIVVLPAD